MPAMENVARPPSGATAIKRRIDGTQRRRIGPVGAPAQRPAGAGQTTPERLPCRHVGEGSRYSGNNVPLLFDCDPERLALLVHEEHKGPHGSSNVLGFRDASRRLMSQITRVHHVRCLPVFRPREGALQ